MWSTLKLEIKYGSITGYLTTSWEYDLSDYLFLFKPHSEIDSSLTLNCYPTNSLGCGLKKLSFDLLVLVPSVVDDGWTVVDRVGFDETNTIELHSRDYQLVVGSLAVIVPISTEHQSMVHLGELPVPFKREADASSFTSRGSLRFHYRNSSSGFQSEYPFTMASRSIGRTTTFRFLTFTANPLVTNLVCFVNLQRENKLDSAEISVECLSETRTMLGNLSFKPNSVGVYEKPTSENFDIFAFSCELNLSIPIFISFGGDPYPQITVEHTHPPAEMYWGNPSKKMGVSKIRRTWSSK